MSGAVIGIAGAVGGLGGVGINLVLRQSYSATGAATWAFVIFGIFYAVAALITWRVYLAVPRDRGAERDDDRVSATLAS